MKICFRVFSAVESEKQKFSATEKTYKLDAQGKPYNDGVIDLQERANSSADTALNKIIARFAEDDGGADSVPSYYSPILSNCGALDELTESQTEISKSLKTETFDLNVVEKSLKRKFTKQTKDDDKDKDKDKDIEKGGEDDEEKTPKPSEE